MGAVAITNVRHIGQMSNARGRVVAAKVTMSSSYATNGDTLNPASLNFSRVEAMAVVSALTGFKLKGAAPAARVGGAAMELAGTPTVPLVKAFAAADGADTEVANATDISEVTADVLFFGR